MITHTMLFKNSKLALVDGRAPKKEGKFSDVAKALEEMGYVIQSKLSEANKMDVVFVKPETAIDELLIALQSHDWTYMYSDSPFTYKIALSEVQTIRALVNKIGEEGVQMVKDYIQKHFPDGGTQAPEYYYKRGR